MSIKSKFFTKCGENAYFKTHDPEFALKMLDKAINADVKNLRAYMVKFSILTRMGQPEGALRILDQAIDANPENAKDIDGIRQAFVDSISARL